MKIRAERLELLFQQSFRAAYTGMIMALLLAAMLWADTEHMTLIAWVLAIAVTGFSRLALYIQYNRLAPELEAIPRWESAYIGTLILYFMVWGFGGLLIIPGDSPLLAAVVCYFLIGMAGSAVAVFSANRTALVAAVTLILSPVIIWLYWQQEPLAFGMALGGTAFVLSSVYASRVLSQSLQQNLELKHELLEAKQAGDELASALSRALDDATEASNAKTRFLASASHDLRQPIHSLSLLSAALGLRPLDDKSREISAGINQSIEALSHQLDALLDISKLDAGVVPVEKRDLDLYLLLENLRDEMAMLAVRRGIAIELDCPKPCPVHSDPTLLERILRNLVNNAIRHNQDCQVQLRTECLDGVCDLIVEDTGTGIPMAEQDKIFEEFYQVDNPSRDKSKGLGLGLAIIRRLQALLDLDMRFVSSPGHGTRFTFTLPRVDGKADLPAEAAVAPAARPGLKVLVVDDEPLVRDSMRHLLEGLGCDAVVTPGTGEALLETESWRPELALVDYRLAGGEDGLDVIDQLRQRYPELPAYLVTGDVTAEQFRAAREAGVEILSKPMGLGELQGILSELEC